MTDALQIVLSFVADHQPLPAAVRAAYDQLRRAERYDMVYHGLGYDMSPSPDGAYLKVGASPRDSSVFPS